MSCFGLKNACHVLVIGFESISGQTFLLYKEYFIQRDNLFYTFYCRKIYHIVYKFIFDVSIYRKTFSGIESSIQRLFYSQSRIYYICLSYPYLHSKLDKLDTHYKWSKALHIFCKSVGHMFYCFYRST